MLARTKAAIAAFIARPVVQSTARHAATAAVGVIVAAIAVGGSQAIGVGVIVAAGAAAARVIQVAVVSYLKTSA